MPSPILARAFRWCRIHAVLVIGLNPFYYLRPGLLLLCILCLSGRSAAQTTERTPAKPAPASTSVTLLMGWTRGDRYYGFHFIQLHSPCQVPSEQKCECTMQFKEISSKDNAAEFADYVSSFDQNKVPVTFRLSYNADGSFSGARMLSLGTWKSDAFPVNDTLLGVKISFQRSTPGQVQHGPKINSPGDCFPASVGGRAVASPDPIPKPR